MWRRQNDLFGALAQESNSESIVSTRFREDEFGIEIDGTVP
jgi:hypothetical protein